MRASGILMPVFSLPGPFGIGTLGSEATAFVDFLAEAKQTYWQILPIGPTGYGDSPYQSFSAFAGNPYFIDFRLLAADGYLTAEEIPAAQPVSTVDYGALYNQRPVLLKKAADRLLAAPSPAYEAFCTAQSFWLEDYALFMAVKAEQGQAGLADWPDALRCREPEVIAAAKVRLADPPARCRSRCQGASGWAGGLFQGGAVLLLHPVERAEGLCQPQRCPAGGRYPHLRQPGFQ